MESKTEVKVAEVAQVAEDVHQCFECDKLVIETKIVGYRGKFVKLCENCWCNVSPHEYEFNIKLLRKQIKKQRQKNCVRDCSDEDENCDISIRDYDDDDGDGEDKIDKCRKCIVCGLPDCLICDTRSFKIPFE